VVAWKVDAAAGSLAAAPFFAVGLPGVYDLAIHPGGSELVCLCPPGNVGVCHVGRAPVCRPLGLRSRLQLRSLHFDGPGRRLFFVTPGGTVGVWDWHKGVPVRTTGQPAFQLAVSADGRWVATPNAAHGLVVYDLESETPLLTLPPESGEVWSQAWSPDGSRLAVGLSDGGLAVWNLEQVRDQLAAFGIAVPWAPAAVPARLPRRPAGESVPGQDLRAPLPARAGVRSETDPKGTAGPEKRCRIFPRGQPQSHPRFGTTDNRTSGCEWSPC
jgi:hypothetical protein